MNAVTMLLATSFVVLSAADDGGPNTLRWAIEQVNATPATKATRATIKVATRMTVTPSRPLPAITQPADLELAKLTLDGAKAGNSDGLVIAADDVYATGVNVSNFTGAGVVLRGKYDELWDSVVSANGTGIEVGGAIDGTFNVVILGNRGDGIHVTNDATGAALGAATEICPFECPAVPPFVPMNDTISGNSGNGITNEGRWTRIDSAVVEHNAGDGILVRGADTTILNSSVSFNAGNGITAIEPLADFEQTIGTCNGRLFLDERGDGPTANDAPDIDAVVNAPHLDSVVDDLSAVTVAGTLDTVPAAMYQLDFVALAAACDQSAGSVGTMIVETDSHGFASFFRAFYKSGAVYDRPVDHLAVMATRLDARKPQPFATSELSAAVDAAANRVHGADLSVSVTSPATSATWGERVPFEIRVTNHGPAAVEFKLSVPPVAGAVYDRGSIGSCWLDGLGFCGIGPLASGESATVRNVVTMPKGVAAFTYRAEVGMFIGSQDVEIDPSNDSAAYTIRLQPPRPHAAKR